MDSGAGNSVFDRPHLPFPKLLNFLPICSSAKGLPSLPSKGIGPCCRRSSRSPLPGISTSPILNDLIRSFVISSTRIVFPPPPWDLDEVLKYLSGQSFEPLAKHHFWTSPRRPCPSGYGYGQTGFGTPSPDILCVIPG